MPESDLPLLLLFVKFPEPGRVKTRIAAEVGAQEAADIYRRMVAAVLDALPPGQRVRVLYDDFRPEADYRAWLNHPALAKAEYAAQSVGDLGDRLTAAFSGAFRDGWQRVGVIGSDCLDLTPAIYQEAWEKLARHDVVIGPTFDGGYYFLALKQPKPELFTDIFWSSELVFQQTLAAAAANGLQIAELVKLGDIDTWQDWLQTRPEESTPAATSHH